METFGDTNYVYHATAARIGAAMMLRLANAEILPYDYVEFARTMRGYIPRVRDQLTKSGVAGAASGVGALEASIGRMEASAAAWTGARDAVLGAGAPSKQV